ncbi:glycosyltransferase family 4 protein [Terriglobus aquaticus]|uniref:Glycosyltransferase family 4 protein n=1 Tax=Terriglobus aquaticus TaxID=940139 RepID=A0ABW9KII7_9BACT|nr:glycosyltransferase family 4 protein [Terriglobus aquaticus]
MAVAADEGLPGTSTRLGAVITVAEALRGTVWRPGDPEHILLLLDQFPAVLGGGERVVLRTVRMLRAAGYRVTIVTFQVECDPDLLAAAECPVYLLPLHSVFSAGALRGAWELGRFLRRARVSVVMTFFESSNLFGGLAVKLLSRAKLIWNRRDMGILREPKHWAAYRRLPWLPDFVIAVSEEVRRHAVEVDRVPPERVGVVYNGVALPAAEEPRTWPERPVVVTVGNLRAVKGQDTLLEAAALVLRSRPEVEFWLAGQPLEAEYVAGLERRVAELGIADRVRFLGGVARPMDVLRQATVFVLPSRSEGFSNAIVEAMAAELPVVATTVGGNAEAVQEGVTGLLVPPEQPEALAEALLEVLQNPERGRAMGEAGRLRAAEKFSEAAMLRELQAAFAKAKGR